MSPTRRPVLVGIAGPSCSGKSSIARLLATSLPGAGLVLPMDHYYHDLGRMAPAARHRFNFDVPESIDLDLLLGNLQGLTRGETVVKPVYLFPEHVRASEGEPVGPADCVVVEGLFALYWLEIRSLLGLAVFVEAPDAVCLSRRIERDVRERGRTRESVVEQYTRTVRPMGARHVTPTRAWAELVLDGTAAVADSVQVIAARLTDPA
ncbi:MAG: uridine kinase [Gemmatimonadota bacterium]